MTTRVIGYCRVSTDKQADKGLSLDAQRAKLQAYATLYDLEVVEVVVDAGASAKSLDREGLQSALQALREGKADGLLVVKLDRLTRSVRDLGELVSGPFAAGKSALMSVEEHVDTRSAAGRMILNILTTVAQWEREAAAERTKAALAVKAKRGERLGRPRYGYRVVSRVDPVNPDKSIKVLVEEPDEQAVIAKIHTLRGEGLSHRDIASAVDLHATQIARILAA